MTSPNGQRRAVLYARVSSEEQASNYSLPSQLEACRKYAESRGFSVVTSFTEDYTGAVPIEQRPEGRKAYAMLSSDEADTLIVYTMDRLVRPPDDGDEWDTPILVRSLAKLGREIHRVDRGKLGTSFAELLIAVVDAKGAGDERRKIIERTSRGRYSKAAAGKVVGNGPAPYGYRFARSDDGKIGALEIDDDEARVIRLIHQWYIYGNDGESMSIQGVARRLSEMKAPTPGERGHAIARRRRGNGMWGDRTVHDILTRELYTGVWHYGKKGPNAIAVSVPPILSREDWQVAQERKKQNSRTALRNTQHEYLLRGRAKCGCGHAMSCRMRYNKHSYYYCWTMNSKRHVELEPRTCHEPYVRVEVLECAVWRFVEKVIAGDFEAELKKAQAAEQDVLQPKRNELEAVLALVAEVEADADDTARALKRARGKVAEKLERDMDSVNDRYATLTAKRDKLQAEIERGALTDGQIETTMQYRNRTLRGLANPTFEDKLEMLEALQVWVEVKNQKAVVHYRMGVSEPIDLADSRNYEVNCTPFRWIELQSEPIDLPDLAAELFRRSAQVGADWGLMVGGA